MTNKHEWEGLKHESNKSADDLLQRLKVNGGYIYRSLIITNDSNVMSMCFVPDNSMEVFAHHIKDAYNQGYEAHKREMSKQQIMPVIEVKYCEHGLIGRCSLCNNAAKLAVLESSTRTVDDY